MTASEALAEWLGGDPHPLAVVAMDIAGRLDQEPDDTTAVQLSRELRQLVRAVAAERQGGDSDLDRFLAELRTPEVRNATD